MKKVGITGAAGFIGSHLCDRLVAEGVEVVGVDDLSRGSLDNLGQCLDQRNFKLRGSSTARAGASCARRSRAATRSSISPRRRFPRYEGALMTLEANVAGVNAAAHAALSLDADLLIASTSDVYGNAEPPFREDGNVTLGPPTSRRWAYAVSKLYDEHVCLALAEERGLKVTILRFFGSYGPRNHPSWWGGPQAAFIETLLDGEMIEIHGDGQQMRTFTYVEDTVDGIVRALRTPEARGEIVNIGGDRPTTIVELAELVHETLGLPRQPLRARLVPYETLPGRYQDVRYRVPSTEKARELLGFAAKVPLEDGLAMTVAWHRGRRVEQETLRA